MQDVSFWQAFVLGVAAPLVLYWLTHGVAARVQAKKARREQLQDDERAAERQEAHELGERARRSENLVRLQEDYILVLRHQLMDTNVKPASWPPGVVPRAPRPRGQ